MLGLITAALLGAALDESKLVAKSQDGRWPQQAPALAHSPSAAGDRATWKSLTVAPSVDFNVTNQLTCVAGAVARSEGGTGAGVA
jgi:hypothetical protein